MKLPNLHPIRLTKPTPFRTMIERPGNGANARKPKSGAAKNSEIASKSEAKSFDKAKPISYNDKARWELKRSAHKAAQGYE
jgi:hypothetical protein